MEVISKILDALSGLIGNHPPSKEQEAREFLSSFAIYYKKHAMFCELIMLNQAQKILVSISQESTQEQISIETNIPPELTELIDGGQKVSSLFAANFIKEIFTK